MSKASDNSENENDEKSVPAESSRRGFLQAGAAILAGASVAACDDDIPKGKIPEPTEQQKALKRKARSTVFVHQVPSYEELDDIMLAAIKEANPPVKDKSVFLKLNLVDYRKGIPCCTNAAHVSALLHALKAAGAREIKVGDGPALSRDTEKIAALNGITEVCKKHDVQFVDLNIDDLEKIDNPLQFTKIPEFVLPRTVVKSEFLVSVPKLKTHHWALMTCSMKNMFGVVPGRKYGWPKNILHIRGINQSILDIVASVKPSFAVVDAVVAMEGDGPLNGTAKELNAIFLGDDLAAVDTVAGMCMELPVQNIPYLRIAGKVLGNTDLSQIDVRGATIESVKKKFVLPPTYEADGKPKNLSKLAKGAESGVT